MQVTKLTWNVGFESCAGGTAVVSVRVALGARDDEVRAVR